MVSIDPLKIELFKPFVRFTAAFHQSYTKQSTSIFSFLDQYSFKHYDQCRMQILSYVKRLLKSQNNRNISTKKFLSILDVYFIPTKKEN